MTPDEIKEAADLLEFLHKAKLIQRALRGDGRTLRISKLKMNISATIHGGGSYEVNVDAEWPYPKFGKTLPIIEEFISEAERRLDRLGVDR